MKITITEKDLNKAISLRNTNRRISLTCINTIAAKRQIPEIEWTAVGFLGDREYITHRFVGHLAKDIENAFDSKHYDEVRGMLPAELEVIKHENYDY